MIMRLTRKQKDQLRSLNPQNYKIPAQEKANIIYKMRKKLRDDLDLLADIEFMIHFLPKDHLRKAIKDNDALRLFELVPDILSVLEFKKIYSNDDEVYVIRKKKNKPVRVLPAQRDIARTLRLRNFVSELENFHESEINIPGDLSLLPICEDDLLDGAIERSLHPQPQPENLLSPEESIKENRRLSSEWSKELEAKTGIGPWHYCRDGNALGIKKYDSPPK